MKPFALDENQQQELLEMVAFLFPEYPEVELSKTFISLFAKNKDEENAISMPCFEFLNTIFLKRISEKVGYHGYKKDNSLYFNYIQYCCMPFNPMAWDWSPLKQAHPVDFFYKLFENKDKY